MSTSRKRSRPTSSLDPDTFAGKVVYCNCDDPFESNFFKYFGRQLQQARPQKASHHQLRRLPPSPAAQLTFGEYDEGNGKRQKPKAIAVEIEEVKDIQRRRRDRHSKTSKLFFFSS